MNICFCEKELFQINYYFIQYLNILLKVHSMYLMSLIHTYKRDMTIAKQYYP